MKKVISIVLSLVMLLSVSVASVNAFAIVGSIESTTKENKISPEVNGKTSTDITYEKDPSDPKKVTFTYTGDGELIGWEFPGLTEGVEYTIISEKGNSITIRVADGYDGEIVANAIVDEGEEEDDNTTKKTTKKNKSEKSPATGASAAAGIAAMGAGAAILTALKKKEDEE